MTRTVCVVITLMAEVPKDMDLKQLKQSVIEHLEDNEVEFGVNQDEYPDEDEQWVIFRQQDTMVGTGMSITVNDIS